MVSDLITPLLDGPETMPCNVNGWWERARAELVRSRVSHLTAPGDRIVDVGGGRGAMYDDDARLGDRMRVCVDSHVWAEWKHSPRIHFVCARAEALPFRDGAFDLVGSFDVLEHLPDDRLGMTEQRRITRPRGSVVSVVPAGPELWSAHDDAVGHQRRYRTADLVALATTAGLHLQHQTHFFSFLWLPARLLRNSTSRRSEPANDTSLVSRIAQLAIGLLSSIERRVVARIAVPFGTSLYCELQRPDTPDDAGQHADTVSAPARILDSRPSIGVP